jgi:hypothetical protein
VAKANLISGKHAAFRNRLKAMLVVAYLFTEAMTKSSPRLSVNVLCNVERSRLCDFITYRIRRGDLDRISTADTALARTAAKELEQDLPEQLGPWLEEIGDARRLLFRTQPDPARRLEALREISSQATFENFLRRDSQSKSKELP